MSETEAECISLDAGRYPSATIGAIDFVSISHSDFPIKRRRMITTMGLVTHAIKSQKRVLRSSHRAIAITRIQSSTFIVVKPDWC